MIIHSQQEAWMEEEGAPGTQTASLPGSQPWATSPSLSFLLAIFQDVRVAAMPNRFNPRMNVHKSIEWLVFPKC